MAAAAILDFVGSQIWWQKCFRDPILNPCVKFGANTCISSRVIKISSKIQNGCCPPSWIIIWYVGPHTKATCWPEAWVQISYQSNQYCWSYRHLKISQIWLKTPIPAVLAVPLERLRRVRYQNACFRPRKCLLGVSMIKVNVWGSKAPKNEKIGAGIGVLSQICKIFKWR